MTEKPYWTADNPHGYSAEDLQHLGKEELIEVMKEWFLQNFEDPAEKTPHESAEGGYQWIWGGPYDASEVLGSEFGEHVPEDVLDEIVAEVEADGIYDWAPKIIDDDEGMVEWDEEPWPPLIVPQLPKQPPDEKTARQEVLDRLTTLEAALKRLGDQSPIMGHNRPPEPLDQMSHLADDGQTIKWIIQVVRDETNSAEPDTGRLEREASKLRDVASRLGLWLKQRLDKGADAFVATVGVGLAANLTGLYQAIVGAWQAIINWIEILIRAL